jgi:hypothetical protein
MLARAMEGQTMKRIILAAAFIALLGSTGVSWSADVQKGWNAYESGDYAAALREWKPLAQQGDEYAQYSLGVMYAKGQGVPQDDKIAVKWYQLAAEQGHAPAQHNLSVMYYGGNGVPQDYKIAVKWLKLAAEQGITIAQNNLGWMYQIGQGVPQNYKTAVKWYQLAAEQGNVDAQSNLGMMYAKGQGVAQDFKTAVKWWKLAAEQGNAEAMKGTIEFYNACFTGKRKVRSGSQAALFCPSVSNCYVFLIMRKFNSFFIITTPIII